EIEIVVVADEDRARAVIVLYRPSNFLEDAGECFLFRNRRAQRMKRVDAGHREGRGLELRARKRLDMEAPALAGLQCAVALNLDQDGRDLEQRIGVRIEPAAFDVDDDGQ